VAVVCQRKREERGAGRQHCYLVTRVHAPQSDLLQGNVTFLAKANTDGKAHFSSWVNSRNAPASDVISFVSYPVNISF
jgi:hypothetical protein